MDKNNILTVADLLAFEERMKGYILSSTQEKQQSTPKIKYLRTSSIKNLLSCSDNKLRAMRECGDIPFTFIGSTYYYPEDEILEILKNNTIKNIK